MIVPPKPLNEPERLKVLKNLKILDTPVEERFERIARIVCSSLEVPIAAISLIDNDRQWFKSIRGLEISETPREVAFCAHTILQDALLVVQDALLDPRFARNPLVTGDPKIRFYAGVPLNIGDGVHIGTLCAIDTEPREIDEAALAVLKDLTGITESEVESMALTEAHRELIAELREAERAALIDPLSKLWNRAGGDSLLGREWKAAQRKGAPISLALLDIDRFKNINDNYGHDVGDRVIRSVGRTVLSALRPYDIVCRWGGEEFLLIFPGCESENLRYALGRVLQAIRTAPIATPKGPLQVTASAGGCAVLPSHDKTPAPFLKLADEALYEAKNAGRDRYAIAPADLAYGSRLLDASA